MSLIELGSVPGLVEGTRRHTSELRGFGFFTHFLGWVGYKACWGIMTID